MQPGRPLAAIAVLLLHGLVLLALWQMHALQREGSDPSPSVLVRLLTPQRPAQAAHTAAPAAPAMASSFQTKAVAPSVTAAPLSAVPIATDSGVESVPAAAVEVTAPAALPQPTAATAAAPPEAAALQLARRAACAQAPHPPLLRERGIEGVVRLRVWVDEFGRAGQVLLAHGSGFRLFDEAAIAQARRCPYEPARRGSEALGSWVEFAVRFALMEREMAEDLLGARCCASLPAAPQAGQGSRRRRLWELGTHAHCPVVGVCLSLEAMRRLARKLLVLSGEEDDYTLHCALVTAAERRNAVSEALQRELEQRFVLDVQQAGKAKTAEELMLWWRGRAAQGEIAGPLWATLSHPRCGEWLEMRVLGQVHMLQHQVGAAQRVDLQRHKELIAEHQALSSEYAQAQDRVTQWSQEHAREQIAWERERLQLRAANLGLQTQLEQAREQLVSWQAISPELPERLALQQRLAEQTERAQALQRELNRLQQAQALPAVVNAVVTAIEPAPEMPSPPQLEQRVVLCVGGRSSTVPLYRRAVEDCGAQFLHHDGGAEHKPAQLEPQLAAADLVICQTGCISHDAYWRVKDHCKRHNKRCVFVDTPSRTAFERALLQAASEAC